MPKPRRTPRSFVALVAVAAPLAALTVVPVARAQTVSDSDRAAARELATQGLQLQQGGKFADALDHFTRAEKIFDAPTHVLHIAQCDVALGKLVEASEQYRSLVRTTLSDRAPNAFVQAQQQATTELAQLEPRIPSLRVIVRPMPVQGTTLEIDGEQMSIATSAALMGVARPANPGKHTVVLLTPGYARAEQSVVLGEKELKDVAFNLGGAGPGTYSAAPVVTTPNATPTYTQPPPAYPMQGEGFPPIVPEHHEANGGFMLGAKLGVLIPAGNLFSGTSLSSYASGGAAVGLDAGFRFVKRLYIGGEYEHGFLGAGSALTGLSAGGTASADSNYIGVNFAVISNPDGAAFYAKLGAGYRYLDMGVTYPEGNGGSATFSGGEVSIAMGVGLKLGSWIRLIPEASVNIGSFSGCSGSVPTSSSASSNLTGGTTTNGSTPCTTVPNTDTHEFVLLGATMYIDFARKH